MSEKHLTSDILNFPEAIDVIEYYLDQGWTDGLPIVPPTPKKVGEFLEYVGLSPSDILGTEPTKGRVITAEKVAINAVMAGCLPQYFPVVASALQAMCEPKFNLHGMSVSTMGSAVLTVVNGPIVDELGLNSGVNVFGPGNRANATIGRAIRLCIINVTGAIPGILDKSTLGHAGKYTFCIAEAEAVNPWNTLQVERGFSNAQSTVTIFAGLSPIQVTNGDGDSPETILPSFYDALFAAGYDQGEVVIILSPEHVGNLARSGWSKREVKQFLYDGAQRIDSNRSAHSGSFRDSDNLDRDADVIKAVVNSPDNITIIVAGGAAGVFSSVIPLWTGGSNSESVTNVIM